MQRLHELRVSKKFIHSVNIFCFEICCPNHLTTQLLMGNSLSFSLFRVQWGCRLLPLICSSNPQYTSKISGIQNIVILNKYNTSMLALYYLELWVTTKSDKISTYNLTGFFFYIFFLIYLFFIGKMFTYNLTVD